MRAGDEVTTEVLARQGRYQEVKDGLRVKEVIVGDGERRRRYVVCHNPAEEARQPHPIRHRRIMGWITIPPPCPGHERPRMDL